MERGRKILKKWLKKNPKPVREITEEEMEEMVRKIEEYKKMVNDRTRINWKDLNDSYIDSWT